MRPVPIAFFFIVSIALPGFATAQTTEISGELLRVSKKRTVILVDLAGDTELAEGDGVRLAIEGKTRSGAVRSISDNGNAMVRLTKGLPSTVKVGDTLKMTKEAAAATAEASNSAAKSVRLVKGFRNKAYWDDVSYLATHRRAGARSDIELAYLTKQGARESSGGTQGGASENWCPGQI